MPGSHLPHGGGGTWGHPSPAAPQPRVGDVSNLLGASGEQTRPGADARRKITRSVPKTASSCHSPKGGKRQSPSAPAPRSLYHVPCTVPPHHAPTPCSRTVLLHRVLAPRSCTALLHRAPTPQSHTTLLHRVPAPCLCTVLPHHAPAPHSRTALLHRAPAPCSHTTFPHHTPAPRSRTMSLHHAPALRSCSVLPHRVPTPHSCTGFPHRAPAPDSCSTLPNRVPAPHSCTMFLPPCSRTTLPHTVPASCSHTALGPAPHSCTVLPHHVPTPCSRTGFLQHVPKRRSHIPFLHRVPATTFPHHAPAQPPQPQDGVLLPSQPCARTPGPRGSTAAEAGARTPPTTSSPTEDPKPARRLPSPRGTRRGGTRGMPAEVQGLGSGRGC